MAASTPLPNLDEISKELNEIECKYTPKSNRKCPKIPLTVHDNLAVLSKEFDSLGLPCINLDKTLPEILEEVVQTTRDLVQKHRNTVNSAPVAEDHKYKELHFKISDYKRSLEQLKESCLSLKNSKTFLTNEVRLLKKQNKTHKEELQKVKQICAGKENQLEHKISKLEIEVERLKELCGKTIAKQSTRNEVALELLRNHRHNEMLYKYTVQGAEENTRKLLEEIFNLKEELIACKKLQYENDV